MNLFYSSKLIFTFTSEKLFINTPASSETFALRSVNGIGVIDLVDEYNKALTIWKQTPITTYVAYILFALGGIWLLQNILYIFSALEKSPVDIVLGIIFDIAIIGVGYFLIKYCKISHFVYFDLKRVELIWFFVLFTIHF
jgi:hypothetical protein